MLEMLNGEMLKEEELLGREDTLYTTLRYLSIN